jgi:hypothetical protein
LTKFFTLGFDFENPDDIARSMLDATQEGALHNAITIRLFEAVNSKRHDI